MHMLRCTTKHAARPLPMPANETQACAVATYNVAHAERNSYLRLVRPAVHHIKVLPTLRIAAYNTVLFYALCVSRCTTDKAASFLSQIRTLLYTCALYIPRCTTEKAPSPSTSKHSISLKEIRCAESAVSVSTARGGDQSLCAPLSSMARTRKTYLNSLGE